MKFTVVFVIALTASTTWAIKTKVEDPKDKREALGGYPSSGHSSHSYQAPSLGHEGASAISVGAGYSIGGAKPSFTYGEPASQHGSGATYQLSSEGLPAGGHATLQLAPLTLQAAQGGFASSDLSQLMSQLSHGLNTGAITIPSGQDAVYQFGGQSAHGQGGQELSFPQFTYGAPKLQQYTLGEQGHIGGPSYAAGTKGLGSYSSTGPVLFTPSESQGAALNYGGSSSGHQSFPQLSYPLGDSGHSIPSFSLGGSGHSFGGSLKQIGASYLPPSKASFKPSTFLGSSVQGEGHGLSSLSGSYGAPSFSFQSSPGGHGLSLGSGHGHGGSFGGSLAGYGSGSTKYVAPSYLPPKSEGGFGSLESIAAFSSGGHIASPPGTTYGVPTGSYSAGNAHTASSSPQYYVTKHSSPSGHSGFGHGSSSFRGPVSSHGSLSSYSSGPKYSFGGHSSSRYGSPKDVQGAYSETSYNTIKYSEELKPQNH